MTADAPPDPYRLTPTERRAGLSLAAIFALRMLGLFLVLPVFALEAARYPGGDDPARVGLAMGVYGLTQALLQVPLGMASDRWGRKRVIQGGLFLFAVGSLVAAWAPTLEWLTAGRALQGAGAISAALTAFIADATRDTVRTRIMAVVGVSIATMFALSMVLAPVLATHVGLSGLFAITALLAVAGMAVVAWVVPPETARPAALGRGGLRQVIRHAGLFRLNVGVFTLHAIQLAMWMAVPALLVKAGLEPSGHWKVYLMALLGSFLLMGGVLFRLERRGYLRAVLVLSIALMGMVQLLFWWGAQVDQPSLAGMALALFLFFLSFNTLEATQPSLASTLAPAGARGAALGVYNTLQSVGVFVGGVLGGWVVGRWGPDGLFMACGGLVLLWLAVASSIQAPSARGVPARA